jgi:anaerobic magnesium-protoporphyrin IX monomethyl ester cyclase
MESGLKINKKIVLVKPENIYGYAAYPPLELLAIGTVLSENGYNVEIINAATQKNYKELLLEKCKNALAVGITSYTSEIKNAIEIVDIIKENFSVPVIWGGWHATLFPVQTCDDKNVDFVITNEGDYSLLRLVRYLGGNGLLENIPGLIYKKKWKDIYKRNKRLH